MPTDLTDMEKSCRVDRVMFATGCERSSAWVELEQVEWNVRRAIVRLSTIRPPYGED